MAFLSSAERKTLALVCDTLIPSIDHPTPDEGVRRLFATSATDAQVEAMVELAIERAVEPETAFQLRLFLRTLEVSGLNGVLSGVWKPLSKMTLDERTRVLQSWATSRYEMGRKAYLGIKRLTMFLFYGGVPAGKPNPAWGGIRYPAPSQMSDDKPRPIQPLVIRSDTTLTCDVLVIGSGAGGGVVAGELAMAGHDVIVVEKGGYYHDTDFHAREAETTETMFERYGALTTTDTALVILAGSVLGGGTTVNWMTSLRPPEHVLREWAREYGFAAAASPELQASLDAISARININTDESHPNPNNAALERGCRALGYSVTTIPRNAKGCEACDTCNFGCSFGAKQSTLKTYLQDAHDHGARIVVQATAERVTHQNGQVTGAELTVIGVDGQPHRVTVKAQRVVAAGGAIQTPALLLRSGLTNPHVGANLRLHPTSVTAAHYPDEIVPWRGAPQTRASFQFADLDGKGYGIWLETAPAHPGLFSLAFVWKDGAEHKRIMADMRHQGNLIVLVRDTHGGRIRLNKRGQPQVEYRVSGYDQRHLMRGLLAAMRVQHASGATEITSPHSHYLQWHTGDDFEAFLGQVEAAGLPNSGYGVFSAHQMGTARIGGTPALGAVKPNGESWEVRGLYVADGSLFPTASGVNPMVTIMGLAHHIAQGMKAAPVRV
jgi:choline dehydrogenase-like flavoprotein